MNKNQLLRHGLVMAAVVISEAFGLVACTDKDDNPVSPTDQTTEVKYETSKEVPTTDQMAVMIEGLTYVFDADYTGEGKCLVNRVAKRAASITDEHLQNIILHASNVPGLTADEVAIIVWLQANGGSLIIIEPTPAAQSQLLLSIYQVVNNTKNPLLTGTDFTKLNWLLGHAGRIASMDGSDDETSDNSVEVVGIRGQKMYISSNPHEEEPITYNCYVVVHDVNGNDSIRRELELTDSEPLYLNDYILGCRADEAAAWMNTPAETKQEQLAARQAAARLINTRAGDPAAVKLDEIANAYEYHLQMGCAVTYKNGDDNFTQYHNALLSRKVYTAYSFEKQCDFYCAYQNTLIKNQNLNCGSSKEDTWRDPTQWDKWKKAVKGYLIPYQGFYGPYLKKYSVQVNMNSQKPFIESYSPYNDASGGQTVSNGVNFNIGANVGVNATGPLAGISGGVTWTHSVSRVDKDLSMNASSNSSDGTLSWSYTGLSSTSYISWPYTCHKTAPSILRSECNLDQAWVWRLSTTGDNIQIQTSMNIVDEFLTCYFSAPLYTTELYIQESFNNTQNSTLESGYQYDRTQTVPCPPHFKQTWAMTIDNDNITGDQREKLMARLKDKLPQFFFDSYVFFTKNAKHTAGQNTDEIGSYVTTSIDAFNNNSNDQDIMRQAGLDYGIPENGSIIITWRQTDAGAQSDNIVYKFDMKSKIIK